MTLEWSMGIVPRHGRLGPSLRRLVVGYDESEGAEAAARFALDLATRAGAEVTLTHVCPSATATDDRAHVVPDIAERVLAYEADWGRRLETVRGSANTSADIRVRLLAGNPAGALIYLAQTLCADAICVGLRGRGAVRHAVAGGTALALLSHAPCPVMLFPEHRVAVGPAAESIVVGVDGSPASDEALAYGQVLAASMAADLVLAHVVDPRLPFVGEPTPAMFAELLREGRALTGHARGSIEEPVGTVREALVEGEPGEELIEACERYSAAAVVVGSRGAGGFEGLLLGSTARTVVDHCTCPVLVTRPAAPSSGGPAS